MPATHSVLGGKRCSVIGACPPTVPTDPRTTYQDNGWQGWGHWLGCGDGDGDGGGDSDGDGESDGGGHTKNLRPLPFAEALAAARSLRLHSEAEWDVWSRGGTRPANVPPRPDVTYMDGGWQGWGHWLGTGNTRPGDVPFLPFDEALAVAQSLGLASQKEWRVWSKEGLRPPNVPSRPDQIYKDGGWQGWVHWLGTGTKAAKAKQFLPFDEALRVARALRLVGRKEWRLWCNSGARPCNIPRTPEDHYAHAGWVGYAHWLGQTTGQTALPCNPPAARGTALGAHAQPTSTKITGDMTLEAHASMVYDRYSSARKGTANLFRVGVLLDFVWPATRAEEGPHGAHIAESQTKPTRPPLNGLFYRSFPGHDRCRCQGAGPVVYPVVHPVVCSAVCSAA